MIHCLLAILAIVAAIWVIGGIMTWNMERAVIKAGERERKAAKRQEQAKADLERRYYKYMTKIKAKAARLIEEGRIEEREALKAKVERELLTTYADILKDMK